MAANPKRIELPAFPFCRSPERPLDPPADYVTLRERDDFIKVRNWNGTEAWLVTRFEDQRQILSDARFSANSELPNFPVQTPAYGKARSIFGRNFLTMDPPQHTEYRSMARDHFGIHRVRKLRGHIETVVEEVLDRMLAKTPPLDLVHDFALPIPLETICYMLGVPYEDMSFFHDHAEMLMSQASEEEIEHVCNELLEYFEHLIVLKQQTPEDDVVSELVKQVVMGSLTRRQLVSMCVLFIVAGHETTANTIALSVLLLFENPSQRELLQSSPEDVMGDAVEELLRYLTVTHSGRRRMAIEDVIVRGQVIHAGEGVILANDAGNRDDTVIDKPDELILTRGFRRHLAFGFGVHQCIGQHLARIEVEIALSSLLRRIPDLHLAVPKDQLVFNEERTVYGVRTLPVAWGPPTVKDA